MRRGMLKLVEQIPSRNIIWRANMVCADGQEIPVIWKPYSGEVDERPGISGEFYKREVAAYECAKILGPEVNVPDTIVYAYSTEPGAVQLWLADAIVGDYVNMDYLIFMNLEQWRWAAAFDYITGNNDRHSGNWMLDAKAKLWLIDNASSFPEENDCWRGSLAILRPMINRKIEIPDYMHEIMWDHNAEFEMVLQATGLQNSVQSMMERMMLFNKAKTFADLVIKR